MPADAPPSLPGAVLFACNFNQVRSPMAEGLLKRLVGDRVYVDSCGLKRPAMVHDDVSDEDVAAGVDPFAVAVMVRQTRQGPTARHRLMQGVARAVEAYWRDSGQAAKIQQQQALSASAVQAGF